MNAYATLDLLKDAGVMNISDTTDDTRLRLLLEAVSRAEDNYCGRHFYALNQAKKYDGDGSTVLLPNDDLISVDSSGVKTDDDKDRTFETTWATTDYLLRPSNADPTTRGNPRSRAYTQIVVDVDAGNEDVWTRGVETVQVTGQWGFWRHTFTATEVVDDNPLSDSATTINVDSRTDVEAGHTLLIESEEVYVKSYSANALTVVRGVNGTTAAAHNQSTAISIYEYPEAIREVCLIEAVKLWVRKDASFASVIGFESGERRVMRGFDKDTRAMLSPYRRFPV